MTDHTLYTIDPGQLDKLFQALAADGYIVVGPTVRDGAIVYDEIASIDDLPKGRTDEQEAGRYRLKRRNDGKLFGYVVGPHSWKKYFFPPKLRLFAASRQAGNGQFTLDAAEPNPPKYALIGVRPCELAAINVQDKVFNDHCHDPYYRMVREGAFVIAVNCPEPGGTCFCASMGTGPGASSGFDLCLTELNDSAIIVQVGTDAGQHYLENLELADASATEIQLMDIMMRNARDHMGRTLKTEGLASLLAANLEHPHWRDIADRCMACANCTLACPTCFCSSVEDKTDLTGEHAERWRLWGSCFTLEFSYIGGQNVRTTISSRYRQWMTHKLSTWHEQFGTSGCVGCGRCITWCPVGIDITAEAATIRNAPDTKQPLPKTEEVPI